MAQVIPVASAPAWSQSTATGPASGQVNDPQLAAGAGAELIPAAAATTAAWNGFSACSMRNVDLLVKNGWRPAVCFLS